VPNGCGLGTLSSIFPWTTFGHSATLAVSLFQPNALGFNSLWFEIICCVNLQVVFSPSFDYAPFFMRGLAHPGITIYHTYGSILPFLAIQAAGVGICIISPPTALSLPSVIFKQ
jgi:TRAP-type mannitol/chloroaromatic compound transport system permease large subunit